MTPHMMIHIVWHLAADAFSGLPQMVGAFHDRAKAEAWGNDHYPGYGPNARDYSISEVKTLDSPAPDLTALRAEVEALRDGVDARFEGSGWQPHEYRLVTDAYEDVLDLIDKHTREGQ